MVFENSSVHATIVESTRLCIKCFAIHSNGVEAARTARRATWSQIDLQPDVDAVISTIYAIFLRFKSDGPKNYHDPENGSFCLRFAIFCKFK